jgi:hypothetical protein
MGKIPNFLNPPDDTEKLTDDALYEWSYLGMHMGEVHAWACQGEEISKGLTERVDYLLEVLGCIEIMEPLTGTPAIHPKVQEWRSNALMTINCINGGSVPRRPFRDVF